MNFDLTPLLLSFKLALVVTGLLAVIGVPLAYWIAFTPSRLKYVIEPLVSMPLVLPPTVLGFYMLVFLNPTSPIGHFFETVFHIHLVFTFLGLVIGSVIFSLPFMVNPIKAAFQSFPKSLLETSYTLGKSKQDTLWHVILPNIQPAFWAGVVMAFAHTIGEFGVVLMIGGSIPGETRVASIAVLSEVEALNYTDAHVYAGILFAICFLVLFILNVLNRRSVSIIQ